MLGASGEEAGKKGKAQDSRQQKRGRSVIFLFFFRNSYSEKLLEILLNCQNT